MSVDITSLAREVYDILCAPPIPVHRTPERERIKKSQFFLNSSNKKAKSVTLHIQGLDSTVSWLTDTHTHTHPNARHYKAAVIIAGNVIFAFFLLSRTSEACVRRLF